MLLNNGKFLPESFMKIELKLYPQRSFVERFPLSKNRQNMPFCQQGRVVHKMPCFVFRVTFLVLNVFSIFFREIVAKYQAVIPYEFQFCTTKFESTAVIGS